MMANTGLRADVRSESAARRLNGYCSEHGVFNVRAWRA